MMRSFFFSAWPLFIGLFCIIVGNSIQGSLIAYRTATQDYSSVISGLIISGYYVGMVCSVFTTPYFLRTVGHVRLFAAFTAIISATLLIFPLVVHPVVWIVLRFFIGFSYVGLFVITEAWVNALSSNETRGQAMSFYMITQFLGYILGQLMLGTTTPESSTLFLLASIGVSLAVVPMLMVQVKVPPQPKSDDIMGLSEMFKLSPFACFGTVMVGMLSAIFYSSLGFVAQKVGMSLGQLSFATILMFLAAMISQWPLAKISDNIDRRKVIIGLALATIAVCFYGFTIDVSNFYLVYLVIFLLSLAVMPLYSINVAHAHDVTPSERLVAMTSTLQLLGASGAVVGPLVLTNMVAYAGFNGFLIFLIIICIMLAGYTLYRMLTRSVTLHSHTVFTPMTQLQAASTEILAMSDELEWDISKGETYQQAVQDENEE